jgi:antirestriction protein ArdC
MKEKSPIEKNAERKQIDLLSEALNGASNANGYWLNASGKGYPKFHPRGVSVSPFNALFMALHSDKNGCGSNLFIHYNEAKAMGMSVREHERGVPFLFYNWNRYVNRNNPEEIISRTTYLGLDEQDRKHYKGVHNREVRTLFNIDQTTLQDVDRPSYEAALRQYGGVAERGYTEADNRKLHIRFNDFLLKMKDSLVPVRYDGSGMPHYETDKDAVYMPRQRNFEHYHDYIQETLRQIVSATGHQQRLAREGMVMKNGMAPSEDALKQERLIVEVASSIKMLELGLPARLSEESLKTVEYWNRELQENPLMMAAIESDVNNALEVIRKAERGEKIEYATIRNRRQTSDMRAELPKHHAIADEIARHPDKDKKTIIVVRDKAAKTADVVLPAGASTEVDNEVPGMNKSRIERALRKEGFEQIRFFNPDGALGFRPDDSYFSGKEVSLARLKNWEIQELSTLDVAPAVKQACEVSFDQVQMIQDDKNRWALYIKPENGSGYSVYPDKEDVNRFFSTLKQAMDNIGKVRMELAHKYHALAETKPDLKVDLFSCGVKDIDLDRIQRVSVFKTKKDGILCAATIDGRKPEPRAVTQQQWQRMWLAEDRDGYKQNLAASLFSDVMRQGQREGNAVETAASAKRQPEQSEQEEQKTGMKR